MGGGARLTEFGKLLLMHCNAMVSNTRRIAQPHLDFLDGVLATTAPPQPGADGEPGQKPKSTRKTPASS